MNKPPDLTDPPTGSGFGDMDTEPPSVGYCVTVSESGKESGMESDGSILSNSSVNTSNKGIKRVRLHSNKKCKTCRKKKKHNKNTNVPEPNSCCCSDNVIIVENPQVPQPSSSTTTTNINAVSTNFNVTDTNTTARPPPVGRTQYESTDVYPYVVHVQKETTNSNDGYTLHPITFGRFLKNNHIYNIVNGSVKRIGRNRMSLSFSNYSDANTFLNHPSLALNNYKAFIPTFSVTRQGIVRGVPADWNDSEVLNNINLPIGCGKVLKMRRFNYKVTLDGNTTWKPSQTILLTFDGQVLPKRIYMCYNALPVELYVYPTIQCFACCRFGHTKVQCRSKQRCYKCGNGHDGSTCNIEEDLASCCLCSGSHFATSKACPEYSRQTAIKKTMADSCLSYAEASKLHPAVHKSFVDILNGRTISKDSKAVINNSQNNKSPPTSSPTTSHRKTIFLKPRSPKNSYSTTQYDHEAHKQLIKDYDMPEPSNGCAFKTTNNTNSDTMSVFDIIMSLINSFTQSKLINPDHAAIMSEAISKISVHNGSQNPKYPSVELP